jgi:hypothetical protein
MDVVFESLPIGVVSEAGLAAMIHCFDVPDATLMVSVLTLLAILGAIIVVRCGHPSHRQVRHPAR